MKKVDGYQKDLAFIHDKGYASFSLEAASGLLDLFRKHPLPDKRIVELGCGSGHLAQALLRRGFIVTGIDSSSAMISLARQNAPKGSFSVSSIWDYHIPRSGAVISIGEVLNYQFDGIISSHRLRGLFTRVYTSLLPCGLFVFDILCARTSKGVRHTKSFNESDTWFVAVEKSDSAESVTRRIVSFRKEKGAYTKSIEIHKVRRYNLKEVISEMGKVGFRVSSRSGYRGKPLGPFHKVIIGVKAIGTNGG